MAIYYFCSDGNRVTQSTIDRNYSKSLKEKHAGESAFVCEGCGKKAVHNDHTIARARLKVIHKTELIWDPECFENSCEQCHNEWESFKNGNWINHLNMERRLAYLKLHDPEGYNIRIELTQHYLENK